MTVEDQSLAIGQVGLLIRGENSLYFNSLHSIALFSQRPLSATAAYWPTIPSRAWMAPSLAFEETKEYSPPVCHYEGPGGDTAESDKALDRCCFGFV